MDALWSKLQERIRSGLTGSRWRHFGTLTFVGLLTLSAMSTSGLDRDADEYVFDSWQQLRGVRKLPSHVALVTIDDAALLALRDDPLVFWTPNHAKVVQVLRQAGVKTIGFDLLFAISPEAWIKRNMAGAPMAAKSFDLEFRRALASGAVVLAGARVSDFRSPYHRFLLPHEDYMFSLPDFDLTRHVGLANLSAKGEVVRTFVTAPTLHLRPEDQAAALPRLALPTLLAVNASGKDAAAASWILGGRTVAANDSEQRIDWFGPPGTVERVPYSRFLAADAANDPQIQALKGRVVIIAGEIGADLHPTPYSAGFFGFDRAAMSGAEIHANVIETLLSGERMQPIPLLLQTLFAGVSLLGFAWLISARGWRWPLVACIVVLPLSLGLSYLAFSQSWLLPVFALHAACLACLAVTIALRFASGSKERARIAGLFGRYVSGSVVDEILRSGAEPNLGGEEVEVTVLFSDIRNFTALAESMSAQDTVALLNRYFERATQVVLEEGGSIDKFIGDAMMVVFGSPVQTPDHARQALRTALRLRDEAGLFERELNLDRLPAEAMAFKIGVGIHTGIAVAGSIGSTRRSEYTVIGDTVNLASRIEGLTKEKGVTILASTATITAAGSGVVCGEQWQVTVRGRQQALTVAEISDLA
jgi:adenylate cyclase